jgi:hypothetical protein
MLRSQRINGSPPALTNLSPGLTPRENNSGDASITWPVSFTTSEKRGACSGARLATVRPMGEDTFRTDTKPVLDVVIIDEDRPARSSGVILATETGADVTGASRRVYGTKCVRRVELDGGAGTGDA